MAYRCSKRVYTVEPESHGPFLMPVHETKVVVNVPAALHRSCWVNGYWLGVLLVTSQMHGGKTVYFVVYSFTS